MTSLLPDIFSSESSWMPVSSGRAELRLSCEDAPTGRALRMDYDFKEGGGFVVARCQASIKMPEAYVVRFHMRGQVVGNQFELKLADASNQNFWRYQEKSFTPSSQWEMREIPASEIAFAWGPAGSGSIGDLGAVEFAIVAGQGGAGTLWLSNFSMEDRSFSLTPAMHASSEMVGYEAGNVLGNASPAPWRAAADDPRPWIVIDSLEPRVLGGLTIVWEERAPLLGFTVSSSMDGQEWKTVHVTKIAGGKRSWIYLPGTEVRCVRLELNEPRGIRRLVVESFEFSRTINEFWHAIARQSPRGWHPRWLHREQSLWTAVGHPLRNGCALMNEEGIVEWGEGSFFVEPFVLAGGKLLTWEDASVRRELLEGWMPVPAVIWEVDGWRLQIQAFAAEVGVHLRYQLTNLGAEALPVKLFLAIRPFQVTPPWQGFRNVGGVSRIYDMQWHCGELLVNETSKLFPRWKGVEFGAMHFTEGCLPEHLEHGALPKAHAVADSFGFATGALACSQIVAPGKSMDAALDLGISASESRQDLSGTLEAWLEALPTAQWMLNGWGGDAVRVALTAASHILITRDGPALQPGPRRYARSWIRDGAIMSAALLRMGCTGAVREFAHWYGSFQSEDGFVPCCVDRDGIDWLVEHDSHGEFIALITDYVRFTGDAAFAAEMWPRVRRAVACLESLVREDGLLPVSVSHEGYLAQPVHSYWDNFWALRGLRDAAWLAGFLSLVEDAQWCASLAATLENHLFASIAATMADRQLDFIPGSEEWADFDPTATANALTLLDVPAGLRASAVVRTFEKYLTDWRRRRTGELPWMNYTPYEIRIIGALVRLEKREAALELLKFFLSDRRPLEWNQWPEIAWHDAGAPAHIGDVPHTWIAAEYVLALRTMIAYESESSEALVIAAGVAPEWLEGDGVRVSAMPTLYGDLSFSLNRVDQFTFSFECGGLRQFPKNGLILRPPLPGPIRRVLVDGVDSENFTASAVVVKEIPVFVTIICSTCS